MYVHSVVFDGSYSWLYAKCHFTMPCAAEMLGSFAVPTAIRMFLCCHSHDNVMGGCSGQAPIRMGAQPENFEIQWHLTKTRK